jgi:hypothetical protein
MATFLAYAALILLAVSVFAFLLVSEPSGPAHDF